MLKNRAGRNLRALFLTSTAALLLSAGQALADLSQADQASIAQAVQSALAGAANPGAQADALKAVADSLLGKFGADNDPQVVAAIQADALADGASQQTVDVALGDLIRKYAEGGKPPPTVPVGGNSGGPVGAGSSSCTNPSCT